MKIIKKEENPPSVELNNDSKPDIFEEEIASLMCVEYKVC